MSEPHHLPRQMTDAPPPRVTPTLPHSVAVCLDALLTVAQVATFFGFLWFAWFLVWVFG